MSNQIEAVQSQALQLSPEERAQLADRLLARLFEAREIEDAWVVEVERRIEEIENGRSMLIPASLGTITAVSAEIEHRVR